MTTLHGSIAVTTPTFLDRATAAMRRAMRADPLDLARLARVQELIETAWELYDNQHETAAEIYLDEVAKL